MKLEDLPNSFGTEKWRIIQGDCTEILNIIPSKSIQVIIYSPPYNLGVSSGGGLKGGFGKGKWKTPRLANGYNEYNDAMPKEEYRKWQADILTKCWDKLTDTGVIFYNHKPRIQNGVVELPQDWNPGLPLRQIIIWKRSGGINFSPSFYLPIHEYILMYAKPDFRLKSKGASGIGDVWDIQQEMNNPHPAPMPVELPNKILQSLSLNSETVVLDPFSGSGTVGVAALKNGCKYIGIEISQEFVEMSIKRLKDTESLQKSKLF